MTVALFGITNDALNLVVNLVILFLIVLWLALVAWTFFDARRRINDGFLAVCAAIGSLIFPFVGTIVYSILRPPEFLDDRRERELEIRAAELRLRQLEEASCPNCEHPVERTYLRCPECRTRIKDPCESCGKPIDPRWSLCPYCENPVRRAAPPERAATPKRRIKQGRSADKEGTRAEQSETPAARSANSRSASSRPPAVREADGGEPPRQPSSRQTRSARAGQRRQTAAQPPNQAE